MAGGSLAQAQGGKPLPSGVAAGIVETLARAMDYTHAQGIVHRDLNPANILLESPVRAPEPVPEHGRAASTASGLRTTDYGLLKISDFGLAKHQVNDSRVTKSGYVMGTPSYMAPEQVRGENHRVGPVTDVYALGAILYELLTGRPPFQAPNSLEILKQISDLDPMPPSRLLPQVPRDLEAITLHCLEKEPARRYPSALALAEDLWCFQQGKPIRARPVSRLERMRKWARRRRRWPL
jgi:serine/threonine protein kinase